MIVYQNSLIIHENASNLRRIQRLIGQLDQGSPSGKVFTFEIDPQRKQKMLLGLDAIGETLTAARSIDTYEMKRALSQPWLEEA